MYSCISVVYSLVCYDIFSKKLKKAYENFQIEKKRRFSPKNTKNVRIDKYDSNLNLKLLKRNLTANEIGNQLPENFGVKSQIYKNYKIFCEKIETFLISHFQLLFPLMILVK